MQQEITTDLNQPVETKSLQDKMQLKTATPSETTRTLRKVCRSHLSHPAVTRISRAQRAIFLPPVVITDRQSEICETTL